MIRILPETLSNKIAAGEVVERPASAVKELVENSLDAGSSRIRVEVEHGGRRLIRVADDGCGMSHDDALLCIERYATSKIAKDPDLFAIHTLGFRGEALPSIASVSRFCLTTRDGRSESGTEIVVEGGRIRQVAQVGAPVGTMITVKQLFYNTPARRKFLKSVATEMGHIAETVNCIAAGWPAVHFKLVHDGRPVKTWIKADAVDRAADVLGQTARHDLLALDGADGELRIAGWVGAVRISRSTSRAIYIYVNGRFVKDRVIQHALFAGYAGRLVKGRYPVALVFLTLPFDQVDVNVHPTKHEVRFAQPSRVHSLISQTVARVLDRAERAGWAEAPAGPPVGAFSGQAIAETTRPFAAFQRSPLENPAGVRLPFAPDALVSRPSHQPAVQRPSDPPTAAILDSGGAERRGPLEGPAFLPAGPRLSVQARLWEKKAFSDLKVIGQFRDTYLVCEAPEGLVLIDQHAAHERIAYERLKKSLAAAGTPTQRLLLPETVEMGFREAQILERWIPRLSALGLAIEPFGGTTFVVHAVPSLLAGRAMGPILTEMAEKIADSGAGGGLETVLDECVKLLACHSAIRGNQPLSRQQADTLLGQLDRCEHPGHCPHGRPTWILYGLKELQKAFQRIV